MFCPFCKNKETQVLESRVVDEGHAVRRRRECSKCAKRFTTYERTKDTVLWVIKKDGRRESFDREKIRRGVILAIEKRPVTLDAVDGLLESVEREMLGKEHEEVESRVIGRTVLKYLKKIDKVAWLRFASVYLEFDGITDFSKAIQKI